MRFSVPGRFPEVGLAAGVPACLKSGCVSTSASLEQGCAAHWAVIHPPHPRWDGRRATHHQVPVGCCLPPPAVTVLFTKTEPRRTARWDPVSASPPGARRDRTEPFSGSGVGTESRTPTMPPTGGAGVAPPPSSAATVGTARASSAPVLRGAPPCSRPSTLGWAVAPVWARAGRSLFFPLLLGAGGICPPAASRLLARGPAASGRGQLPGTEAFGPDLVHVDASPSSGPDSAGSASVWGAPSSRGCPPVGVWECGEEAI